MTDFQKLVLTCAKKSNLSRLESYLQPVTPADVNIRDTLGNSPLHYAAKLGNKALVAFLVERGAIVNVLGAGGDTPLHLAFLSGDKSTVEYLISQQASPNSPNEQGETPICFANKYLIKQMDLEQAICKVADDRAEFDNRIYFEFWNPDHHKRQYPTELSSLIQSASIKKYVKNYSQVSTEYTKFK